MARGQVRQIETGSAAEAGPEQGADEKSLVPAVTRAVAILDLLAGTGDPLGVSEISRRLRLPKSSVANLCTTLIDTGLLRTLDGGFALGQRLAHLGAAYLAGVDQVRLFHESCQHLDEGRNDTAQLAVLSDGLDVIYLARRDGVYPVRLASTPGRALPATCTATGKAMLATLSPEELQRRLDMAAPLPRLTPRSITSVPKLKAELDKIRRQGYALDQEEVIEGVVCVAAAVAATGAIEQPLAVSITLLKPRATAELLERLASELQALTGRIAQGLGLAPIAPPGRGGPR